MSPTFGSLFAGVGGMDLGLERAGWECMWQAEIDDRCQDVLRRRFPDAHLYDDVRKVDGCRCIRRPESERDGADHSHPPGGPTPRTGDLRCKGCDCGSARRVDLVCGGFPCQDLSVAGRRQGLAGERSGLWWEFHRVLSVLRPRWCVIENVPGLLSSNGGRDMGTVLGGLADLGYGFAYRVLDAQWFGVAQRRRRVFIVGHLGGGGAAQVLLEPEGSGGDSPPSRTAGTRTAGGVAACLNSGGNDGGFRTEPGEHLIAARALPAERGQRNNGTEQNLIPIGFQGTNGIDIQAEEGTTPPIKVGTGLGISSPPNVAYPAARVGMAVRRLTPTECERLQGFPDGWTDGQPDSVRYRQLGNAVAVPVAEWIGRRIAAYERMEVAA